jgi:Zn finger protein HypA/HybF involved in hydrogenase expression
MTSIQYLTEEQAKHLSKCSDCKHLFSSKSGESLCPTCKAKLELQRSKPVVQK